MKKSVPFEWEDACQNAYENIKQYLICPLVLTTPIPRKPLILYITAQEQSLGVLIVQVNDEGKENALYHLSRTLVGAELNYSPIEKNVSNISLPYKEVKTLYVGSCCSSHLKI